MTITADIDQAPAPTTQTHRIIGRDRLNDDTLVVATFGYASPGEPVRYATHVVELPSHRAVHQRWLADCENDAQALEAHQGVLALVASGQDLGQNTYAPRNTWT